MEAEVLPPKMEQKEAVFKFITETLVIESKSVEQFIALLSIPKEQLNVEDKKQLKAIRKTVRQRLFASIKAGETKLSKQYDDSRLKKYCSGLFNNWVMKDPRFK